MGSSAKVTSNIQNGLSHLQLSTSRFSNRSIEPLGDHPCFTIQKSTATVAYYVRGTLIPIRILNLERLNCEEYFGRFQYEIFDEDEEYLQLFKSMNVFYNTLKTAIEYELKGKENSYLKKWTFFSLLPSEGNAVVIQASEDTYKRAIIIKADEMDSRYFYLKLIDEGGPMLRLQASTIYCMNQNFRHLPPRRRYFCLARLSSFENSMCYQRVIQGSCEDLFVGDLEAEFVGFNVNKLGDNCAIIRGPKYPKEMFFYGISSLLVEKIHELLLEIKSLNVFRTQKKKYAGSQTRICPGLLEGPNSSLCFINTRWIIWSNVDEPIESFEAGKMLQVSFAAIDEEDPWIVILKSTKRQRIFEQLEKELSEDCIPVWKLRNSQTALRKINPFMGYWNQAEKRVLRVRIMEDWKSIEHLSTISCYEGYYKIYCLDYGTIFRVQQHELFPLGQNHCRYPPFAIRAKMYGTSKLPWDKQSIAYVRSFAKKETSYPVKVVSLTYDAFSIPEAVIRMEIKN